MRERVDLKSPVRENRPPGSVRGASGNRRPYLDTLALHKPDFTARTLSMIGRLSECPIVFEVGDELKKATGFRHHQA
jgi:hypothetical protein